jgi:hypothetical protein
VKSLTEEGLTYTAYPSQPNDGAFAPCLLDEPLPEPSLYHMHIVFHIVALNTIINAFSTYTWFLAYDPGVTGRKNSLPLRCRFWPKLFSSFASNSLENVHIEFVTDHRSSAVKGNCDPDHIVGRGAAELRQATNSASISARFGCGKWSSSACVCLRIRPVRRVEF